VHVWRSGRPSATLAKEAAPAVGFLVLLSPTAMQWYATWALPFAVIEGQRFWMWWTGLICVAFLVMIDGVERPLLLALEYGALALAAFLDFRFQDKRKT